MLSIPAAARWYNANRPSDVAGCTIPAAEHGTITSWGKAGEVDAYKNMIRQFLGPNKMVAVVSDAYNLWNAIEHIWGDLLRSDVENSGGVLVIRPDSGDPATVVCKALTLLGERFGYSLNSKGYRLLPNCVRLIQGDGISYETIGSIIDAILDAGWSIDNVSFGMGGGLLQDVQRDDIGWCQKVSAVQHEGIWYGVSKDPIDAPSKRSKEGRQVLTRVNGEFVTLRSEDARGINDLLEPVFNTGELLIDESLDKIRNRTGLWF